jgi:hypothetical protein
MAPIRANLMPDLKPTFLNFRKGRKTRRETAILQKDTKLESSPVRFPLINPNENAQINDTSNK